MTSEGWEFDRETAIRRIQAAGDTTRFAAEVSPAWNIGLNPNGGYVLATLVRALRAVSHHDVPLSVTTHFERPALPGEQAVLEVDVVREGRTLSTLAGRFTQGGKERLRCLAALGASMPAAGRDAVRPLANSSAPEPPIALPAPEDCPSRAVLAQGIELPLLERVDVRIHPDYTEPGSSATAEIGGWIRFTDGRPADELALFQFCDAFPPSPFSLLGQIGWVPTIELTVHLRRRPVGTWIGAWFRTDDLSGELFVEDGVLWDDRGVVAYCRQLGLLRRDQ